MAVLPASRSRYRRAGPGGEAAHGANEAGYVDDLVAEANVYAATIERLLLS
ncbi:MAG: hypothetical protein R2848_13460 [Thermomicrobiales bacterium]